MRITTANQTPVPPADNGATPASRGDGAAPAVSSVPLPAQTAASAPASAYNLVPSFELLTLNALLQQVPPVREDVINATVQRLAADQLRSPDATARTARAILGI